MRVIHVVILLTILENCVIDHVNVLSQKLHNCSIALINNSFRLLVTFTFVYKLFDHDTMFRKGIKWSCDVKDLADGRR